MSGGVVVEVAQRYGSTRSGDASSPPPPSETAMVARVVGPETPCSESGEGRNTQPK